MATPPLYAHRLGRAYGPDSSAAALAGSLAAGVDGLETDVCATSDGDTGFSGRVPAAVAPAAPSRAIGPISPARSPPGAVDPLGIAQAADQGRHCLAGPLADLAQGEGRVLADHRLGAGEQLDQPPMAGVASDPCSLSPSAPCACTAASEWWSMRSSSATLLP